MDSVRRQRSNSEQVTPLREKETESNVVVLFISWSKSFSGRLTQYRAYLDCEDSIFSSVEKILFRLQIKFEIVRE